MLLFQKKTIGGIALGWIHFQTINNNDCDISINRSKSTKRKKKP